MSQEFGLEGGEFDFDGALFENDQLFDDLLDNLEFDEAARAVAPPVKAANNITSLLPQQQFQYQEQYSLPQQAAQTADQHFPAFSPQQQLQQQQFQPPPYPGLTAATDTRVVPIITPDLNSAYTASSDSGGKGGQRKAMPRDGKGGNGRKSSSGQSKTIRLTVRNIESGAMDEEDGEDDGDEMEEDEVMQHGMRLIQHHPAAQKRKQQEQHVKQHGRGSGGNTGGENLSSVPKLQRTDSVSLLPVSIFKAFNGGDIPKVKDIIKEHTTSDCSLKTPALDSPLIGQSFVMDLFEAIYETHPDAVWVAKKCRVSDGSDSGDNQNTKSLVCKIYFAGTRIATGSFLSTAGTGFLLGGDLNNDAGTTAQYLFKKPGSSLLDEMDISLLNPPEIAAMKELESTGRNLSVFGKGTWRIDFDASGCKACHMVFDWKITSFREADL